jgi:hypothetical protein
MAVYDPPQPLWKRNLAGLADFFLAFFAFGILLSLLFGDVSTSYRPDGSPLVSFNVGPVGALLLVVLIPGYFIILGRTGGTAFQRLFGMKRAKRLPGGRQVSAAS